MSLFCINRKADCNSESGHRNRRRAFMLALFGYLLPQLFMAVALSGSASAGSGPAGAGHSQRASGSRRARAARSPPARPVFSEQLYSLRTQMQQHVACKRAKAKATASTKVEAGGYD